MTVKESVLRALERARGERLSGEALAQQLGVSRAAVWKAIRTLRQDGLQIDATPGEGYCLLPQDDSLTAAGVQAGLTTRALGRALLVLPSVTSTNTMMKADYIGRENGFTLIAAEQTAGRGRLGRTFVSPAESGLYLSVLLRESLSLPILNLITIAAAVAVHDAIEETAGFSPDIKWVNDILFRGKKLCGILTEASIEGESGTVSAAVIGIGINLLQNPNWPEDIREIAGALGDFAPPVRRAALAASILNHLEKALELLQCGGKETLLERYRSCLCCLGREITVFSPAGSYAAHCLTLDGNGHLLVRDEAGRERILSSGEISIRL